MNRRSSRCGGEMALDKGSGGMDEVWEELEGLQVWVT